MNKFSYEMPVKVHFGQNCVKEHLLNELSKFGNNIMVAYGGGSIKRNGIYDEVMSILKEANKNIVELTGITANPTYSKVLEGIELYKRENIDLILAIGGGSVVDCCKIIAAGAKCDEDIWQMEINENRFPKEMGNFAVILTLSGAGAEMDCLGACTNESINQKKTFVGPYPSFALLNPTYLMSVPLEMFMPGVFDSLSHCMETYFGKESNVGDDMNEGLMRNIVANMKELIRGNDTIEIRSNLMWDASLIQTFIFAIAKAGDFQAHQIENMLAAYSHGTHGSQLAVIHPKYYRYIYKTDPTKFAHFATRVLDISKEDKTDEQLALEAIETLEQLIKDSGLKTTLHELGYELTEETARKVANTCGNPQTNIRPLTRDEIFDILMKCK